MWLARHNQILSNKIRARRGMTNDAFRKACGALVESLLHILRDIFVVRKVWDELLPPSYTFNFFSIRVL